MKYQIPGALKTEHEELHDQLVRATKAGGRTGEAAKAVAKLMHPHFIREEQYALPPLGLLAALSKGKVGSNMVEMIKITDQLESELPNMLAEHKNILAALKRLKDAAEAEDKLEFVDFAHKLKAHARTEEEVSYPTARLIGRYLKIALSGPNS